VFDVLVSERRRRRMGRRAVSRELEIGRAKVLVDHGFQWDGVENVWLTRARTCFVMEAGPVFDIRPRSGLARVTSIFGGTSSGDHFFDHFFSVRGADPARIRSLLSTRVRFLLASSLADARLVSDGRRISLWREGRIGRGSDAAIASEIVSEIAHHQVEHLDTLSALPGADPYEAAGSWERVTAPGVVINGPTPVYVAPSPGARGPCTSVWADCGREVGRFLLRIDEFGRAHGDHASLPLQAHFGNDSGDAIGACVIVSSGRRVALRFPGLEDSVPRLQRAIELVRSISDHSRGVYR
jgi:hypothetical protein